MTAITKRNVAELNIDAPIGTNDYEARNIEKAAVLNVFTRLQSAGLIDANAKLNGTLPDNSEIVWGLFGKTDSNIGKEIKRRMQIMGFDNVDKAPKSWEAALTVLLTDVDQDKKFDIDLDILRKSGLLKAGTTNAKIQEALTGKTPSTDAYTKAAPQTDGSGMMYDTSLARSLTFRFEQTTNEINKGVHRNEANYDVDVIGGSNTTTQDPKKTDDVKKPVDNKQNQAPVKGDNKQHQTKNQQLESKDLNGTQNANMSQDANYQASVQHLRNILAKYPNDANVTSYINGLLSSSHGIITDAEFKSATDLAAAAAKQKANNGQVQPKK